MWNQSIVADILLDDLLAELSAAEKSNAAVQTLKKALPSLSDGDAIKVCQLLSTMVSRQIKDIDSVEIVATMPVSFRTSIRKTRPVIEELINGAKRSIIFTGYAISSHFEEYMSIINQKSNQGILVELYVNNYEKTQPVLSDIIHTNRSFMNVYEYSGKDGDKMAALHAKTIIVDSTNLFLSSANLSYHGLDGNIEIGALISSKRKAEQILSIFSELKRQKVFILVK